MAMMQQPGLLPTARGGYVFHSCSHVDRLRSIAQRLDPLDRVVFGAVHQSGPTTAVDARIDFNGAGTVPE